MSSFSNLRLPASSPLRARTVMSRRDAMTLIEVSISLAIAVFTLTVLVSLIGAALTTSRRASDESVAALLQQRVATDLRSQPFDAIQLSDDASVTLNLSLVNTNRAVNYRQEGQPTNSAAYFRAVIHTQPSTNLPDLAAITLQVIWPATAAAQTTNTVHTWVARRQ